jgi:hypothetical protein
MMKRKLVLGLTIVMITISIVLISQTDPIHIYDFDGDFTDSQNGNGSLSINPTTDNSGFETNEWWWEATDEPGGGLILGANLTDDENYSLSFKIKFQEVTGYRKIISFHGTSSDNGLYYYNSNLKLYPGGSSSTSYSADTFYEFIMTRTSDSGGIFKMYTVDEAGTMTEVYNQDDSAGDAIPISDGNGNYEFRFFTNDVNYEGEWTHSGAIRSLKVWDYTLTTENIEDQIPDPVSNIFPSDLSADMPQTVTINWEYNGNRLPTGFKVFQGITQIDDIPYSGDILYGRQLNQAAWSSTVNWKVVAYNDNGDNPNPVTWSFTVMDEPADPASVPTEIVYEELPNYTGTDPEVLTFQIINLGGNVQPTLDLSFASSVSHFDIVFEIQDQPNNPHPYPENCGAAFNGTFPDGNLTTIVFGYGANIFPDELLHWNGSSWTDITLSSNAVFDNVTNHEVTFEWTSGRGEDEFAVNGNPDAPLPVTLSSFTATFSNGSSLLSWTTQSESNNLGWNVYRSKTENVEDYEQINEEMIEGAGTTTEQTDYTYADQNETIANNSYWYWIESVDQGGATTLHGPARIDIPDDEDELPPELLSAYGLAQNFPNPFNPTTKIAFKLTEANAENAKLIIYNPKGQIVKVFTDLQTNGNELGSVIWKGDDEHGNTVSSGIYLYKMKAGGRYTSTKKMILLK